uniref:Putative secreted protein n=1 Tax=Aedes albopictus TaxID=7160 RepID=A0A1W7R718_AEDAL
MLLRDAAVDILALDLVVQALLDFAVNGHCTFTVGSLQLEGNILFLGLHQQGLALGTPLFLLLVFHGLGQLLDIVFAVGLPFAFDSIDFLVAISSHSWSELLDGVDDHDGQRQTVVVFVLHDVDFLGAQVGQQTSSEHVRTGNAGFIVEEGKPFLWQEAHPNFSGVFRAHGAIAVGGRCGSAGHDQTDWLLGGGQKCCSRKHFEAI